MAYKLYRSSYNCGNRLFYPPQHLLLLYFLRYIEEYHSTVIRRTREEIHEETGISVKTLNRTIRKLKESGMVDVVKGKVTLNEAQQEKAREYIKQGMY
ncbi:helix-turn-helix domain-containing protein [uncultured Merdimonas sp.]|uniref:helix-turn-helix domain-containing protein n=1 Tax=uncultured Merdimonas sp. TaxID=2023269 RepID=UPI00320A9292